MNWTAIDRRALLAGLGGGTLLATFGSLPALAGDTAAPIYLTAYGTAESPPRFGVAAVRLDGGVLFATLLPGRAHAVVPRPGRREAVVFARRPGPWMVPLDTAGGVIGTPIPAEPGRPFTGHGAFDAEGRLLYVGEDFSDEERGAVGVYDAADGYRRLGALPTHGIGPHEVLGLDGGRTLVVGNGGIITHPETGRAKLNVDSMDASLTWVEATSGRLLDQARLPPDMANLGIRHLAALDDGSVAFGCQDERPTGDVQALVGAQSPGKPPRLFEAPEEVWDRFQGYIGSVASDGRIVAASSPRGGIVGFWDGESGRWLGSAALQDGCGIAPAAGGFAATNGFGAVTEFSSQGSLLIPTRQVPDRRWDNHLTPLA